MSCQSCRDRCVTRLQEFVDPARQVPLEAALNLAWGLPLLCATRGICLGLRVTPKARQNRGVQGAVQLPIATPVEAVADGLAG